MHFYSRSRDEIWHKGETSGNVQRVRQLRYDCDGDALVALVEPTGPACHTGERICFYRDLDVAAAGRAAGRGRAAPGRHEALAALERTLRDRAASAPDGSYTVELLDDPTLIGEKVEEEAEEVVRAAARRDRRAGRRRGRRPALPPAGAAGLARGPAVERCWRC